MALEPLPFRFLIERRDATSVFFLQQMTVRPMRFAAAPRASSFPVLYYQPLPAARNSGATAQVICPIQDVWSGLESST